MTKRLDQFEAVEIAQPIGFTLSGEKAIVELIARDGTTQPVLIDRTSLALVVAQLTRAHLSMEYVAATRGAPVAAPSVDVERVLARLQLGETSPTLTVQSGLVQHFCLSPDQAEALAAELMQTAATARANKRPSH